MKEIILACNLDAGEITQKRLYDFNSRLGEIAQDRPFTPDNFSEYGNADINLLNNLVQIRVTLLKNIEISPSLILKSVLEALDSIYINKVFGLSLTYNENIVTDFNIFETEFQNKFRSIEEGIIGAGIKYAISKDGHNFDVVYEPSYGEYNDNVFNKYYFQVSSGFNADRMEHQSIVNETEKLYDLSLQLRETSQEIFQRVDYNDDSI